MIEPLTKTSPTGRKESRLIIVGDYLFDPAVGLITGPSGSHYVCPRMSSLLLCLVDHAGELVSTNELLQESWQAGESSGGALSRCITRLRHYFRDFQHPHSYIESVPGRGHRLIAPVYGSTDTPVIEPPRPTELVAPRASSKFAHLLNEFRNRKVCRSLLIYSIVIWLIFQISEIVVPALAMPDWVVSFIVVLGMLGFPIAAVLSWIFDITPEGVVRELAPRKSSKVRPTRRRFELAIDVLLLASAIGICALLLSQSLSVDLSGMFGEGNASNPVQQDQRPNSADTPTLPVNVTRMDAVIGNLR